VLVAGNSKFGGSRFGGLNREGARVEKLGSWEVGKLRGLRNFVAGCPSRKPRRHPEGGTTEGSPGHQPAP